MRYKTIKSAKEITLKGELRFELDSRNDSHRAVNIFDASGNCLRVEGEYGVTVMVQAPPKTETKYRLTGRVSGLEIVPQVFDSQSEATNKKVELSGSTDELEIEQVEVVVES
jgi:hypothetical protein